MFGVTTSIAFDITSHQWMVAILQQLDNSQAPNNKRLEKYNCANIQKDMQGVYTSGNI